MISPMPRAVRYRSAAKYTRIALKITIELWSRALSLERAADDHRGSLCGVTMTGHGA
jgi:hypothetical protein